MQKLHGRKLKEGLFVYLMLAYPLLQFLIFYVGVNFNSVLLAFKKYDGGIYEFLPLSEMFSNFRRLADSLFADDTLVYSTVNSVKLYLSGLLIGTPLNIIFAYCIYKKVPAAGFFALFCFCRPSYPILFWYWHSNISSSTEYRTRLKSCLAKPICPYCCGMKKRLFRSSYSSASGQGSDRRSYCTRTRCPRFPSLWSNTEDWRVWASGRNSVIWCFRLSIRR